MSTAGKKIPVDPKPRRLLKAAAFGGSLLVTAGAVTVGVVISQVKVAKRIIPLAEAPPPRGDGRYGPRFTSKPIKLVVLGDSSAAGFGVRRPRETPAALLANGLARRLQRPVVVRTFAVVGATSARMGPQVEAALEEQPDLAVILIGANDVTHNDNRSAAVRYLADAVRTLRAAGAEVVVGTCPDLGAIRPIHPPLRWLARYWSRQLAAAQTVAVVEAGGWTVSLGDLIGPRFVSEPHKLFGGDRFHPSADGYAVATAAMLPTAIAAMLPRDDRPAAQTATHGVRSLPQAAVEAVRQPGTEVSGVSVAGRERGPGGRWAELRHRMWDALRLPENPAPAAASRRWTASVSTEVAVEGQPT
jgi:lysophospholipase L1-like esterase